MPETRLAEHLRRYPLFAKLADAEVAQLAERMRSFKRGEALFRLERREIIGIRRRHIVIVDAERLAKEIRV